jgi:hypothetical protein
VRVARSESGGNIRPTTRSPTRVAIVVVVTQHWLSGGSTIAVSIALWQYLAKLRACALFSAPHQRRHLFCHRRERHAYCQAGVVDVQVHGSSGCSQTGAEDVSTAVTMQDARRGTHAESDRISIVYTESRQRERIFTECVKAPVTCACQSHPDLYINRA